MHSPSSTRDGGMGAPWDRHQHQGVTFFQTPREYIIKMDMPGFSRSEISTEIDELTLKVHAQTSCPGKKTRGQQVLGMWQKVQSADGLCLDRERRLEMILPQETDVEHAKASLVHGILTLRFPRLSGSAAKHKHVSIYDEFEAEHVYYAKAKESAGGAWTRFKETSKTYFFSPVSRFLGLQRPLASVRQKASQMGQRATEQASRIGHQVTEQVKQIPKSASGYLDKAQEQVGQGMQQASEWAEGAREQVGQVPHYVAEQVGKAVHGAQEQIHKGQEYVKKGRDQGSSEEDSVSPESFEGLKGERHKSVTLISMY